MKTTQQWQEQDIVQMDDDLIEKYIIWLDQEKEYLDQQQQKHIALIKKRETMIDKVVNTDTGARVAEWKERNIGLLDEWQTWKQQQEHYLDELVKKQELIHKTQEEVRTEQERRIFEKIKQKYATIIQKLRNQYMIIENTLLGTEKKEIEQKRKTL